jgi:hypothetical protein
MSRLPLEGIASSLTIRTSWQRDARCRCRLERSQAGCRRCRTSAMPTYSRCAARRRSRRASTRAKCSASSARRYIRFCSDARRSARVCVPGADQESIVQGSSAGARYSSPRARHGPRVTQEAILRELERFRANSDIQRSMALKMAEARLAAIEQLARALASYVNTALSVAASPLGDARNMLVQSLSGKADTAQEAARRAAFYVPIDLDRDISQLNSGAIDVASEAVRTRTVLTADDARVVEILRRHALASI